MATKLQRQFCRSRIFREPMNLALMQECAPIRRGSRRLYNSIYADVFADLPEPYIKRFLYAFIACDDVTAEDRAEALRLLQLSSTALTEDQRQQILSFLQAE